MNRRCFLRHCAGAGALSVLAPTELLAAAVRVEPLVIGHVAPASGPGAAIGGSAVRGAQLAAAETAQTAALLGRQVQLVEASAAGAREALPAAARLIERGARVVLGGFDRDSAEALSELAEEHGVLFLNVGWAGDTFRTRCRPTTFHIEPSEFMRGRALEMWEEQGGDPEEGSAAVAWNGTLNRYGAGQLNDRHRVRFGVGMDGAGWTSWMAVKVAWETFARTRSAEAGAMAGYLTGPRASFDGHKGIELSFRREDHQLRQPLYIARFTADGEMQIDMEVPSPSSAARTDAAEVLDVLLAPPECAAGAGR